MKEINFYCIEEDVNIFLYNFLNKLIEKDNKIIIHSENEDKMLKLDSMLWSLKKTSFLPHLLASDKFAEKSPILISNTKENKNNANFLLLSVYNDDINFLEKFEKIFYIFTPASMYLINEAKISWEKYKNLDFNLKLFKKNIFGKWEELNNFNVK